MEWGKTMLIEPIAHWWEHLYLQHCRWSSVDVTLVTLLCQSAGVDRPRKQVELMPQGRSLAWCMLLRRLCAEHTSWAAQAAYDFESIIAVLWHVCVVPQLGLLKLNDSVDFLCNSECGWTDCARLGADNHDIWHKFTSVIEVCVTLTCSYIYGEVRFELCRRECTTETHKSGFSRVWVA